MTTRQAHRTSKRPWLGRSGLVLLLFACQAQAPATFRWIEDDATELLTDDRLYSAVAVFDWSFAEPPKIHPEPRGMIFQVAGGVATLEHPAAIAGW